MAGRKSTAQRPGTQRPGDVPANVPVASTQARPTTDVTQGVDASQDAQKRYVAPARTAGGFAGSMPQPNSIPPQYPEMRQASPEEPLAGSIGATGTAIMSGILVNEDYNPDFGWRKGVEIFDQMRRSNGTVRAIEQLLAMPLRAATWSIKPASEKPEDKKLAAFVESALFHELEFTTPEGVEQHQTWDDLLRHICLMMTYGFMPFEMVWRQDDAGFNKWAQWIPLLPKTVWRWWVNQQTDLVGIQQRTYINYGWYYRDIPASKLVLFSNEREGNNYEGMSVFRAAYPHWFYLQQYYKIQAVGIERNAVTPPIGYLGATASTGDRDNLFQVVQNMRVGESMGAVIKADEKIEYPANHQSSGADVQQAIDHHMQMVAQAAVTSFLTLGASAKGAYNLAESLINMLMTLLQARSQYICDTINAGPIKQLIRYNFGAQDVYPQLTVGRLTATDLTRVANALAALAGYIPPSNEITDFLTKMIGLPEAAHSEIQATNPTGKDGGDGSASEAVKETQRVGMNIVRQNFNPALSEANDIATEARLLREAIGALTGSDAVERGMTFFNPNHDARTGEFAPGGAGGEAETKASGGGRKSSGGGRTSAKSESSAAKTPRSRSGSGSGGSTKSSSGRSKAPKEAEKPAEHTTAAERQRAHEAKMSEHEKAAQTAMRKRDTAEEEGRTADATRYHEQAQQHLAAAKEEMLAAHREGTVARSQDAHGAQLPEIKPGNGRPSLQINPQDAHEDKYLRTEFPQMFRNGKLYLDAGRATDVKYIAHAFGEHQTGAVLHQLEIKSLRKSAEYHGLDTKGSKAVLVSRLTKFATGGRYSASFSTKRSPAEVHAAKAATLKARLDAAQAAYDAHMAKAPKLDERDAWRAEGKRLLAEVHRLTLMLDEARS